MSAIFSMILTQVAEHPFHVLLEVLFAAALAAALALQYGRKKGTSKENAPVMPSLEEQERRIAEFRSQPFRADGKQTTNVLPHTGLNTAQVDSRNDCYITLRGISGGKLTKCLDLATEDFHSFSTDPTVVEVARKVVVEYGVGSCGPRGFYGTFKSHLDAEADIAKFLKTDSAIIYSFSFATISTLISCFSGRGDYLVVDEEVTLSVAEGCTLSRSSVLKYRHNDMTHLEDLLQEIVLKETSTKTLSRRFVVTEGIFKNSGDICKLPRILELCKNYKFRLILEDSYGFGCLGPTARGTPEHFGISMEDIDVYVGSLSTSLGGVGGFCAGEKSMVEYQRLSASAYVFSASLPPYITSAVSAAVSLLDSDDSYAKRLQENAKLIRKTIREAGLNREKITMIECDGDVSPIVVLRPTDAYVKQNPHKVEEEIEEVVQRSKERNVLLLRHIYSSDERCKNSPGLRILVKSKATREEIQNAVLTIIEALKAIFS